MQRTHPGEPAIAPAHGFRPREGLDHLRHDLADDLDGRAASSLDHRHVEVALLGILLDLGLIDRGQPGRLEETPDGAFRGADTRALLLVLLVGLARRHALHREREPARRRERLGALVDQPGRDQSIGDELLQVLGRARLHAGRDFLGE